MKSLRLLLWLVVEFLSETARTSKCVGFFVLGLSFVAWLSSSLLVDCNEPVLADMTWSFGRHASVIYR
jgi:hypothetical protein